MLIPHYGYGGAQRVFSQLTNFFVSNYNVVEVVFDTSEPDVYGGNGNKEVLNTRAGRNLLEKSCYFLERCRKLKHLKKKYAPSHVISHLEGANFVNLLAGGPGKKIICVHGSKTSFDSNRRGVIRFIEDTILVRSLYNRADRIVTVSAGIAQELTTHFDVQKEKIKIIPNGIDIDNINRLSEEALPEFHQQLFSKPTLIFSARLVPQKNPLPLIDIYKRIRESVDINLIILGEGALKPQMKKRCDELNIPAYEESENHSNETGIFFLGFKKNPFPYISRATLFLLTSDFEGYPLGVCEALACGVPVLATDCPTGVREILASDYSATNHTEKISNAVYSDYGVLMPLLNSGDNNRIVTWAQTIISMLNSNEQYTHYQKEGLKRAYELRQEIFLKNWSTVM